MTTTIPTTTEPWLDSLRRRFVEVVPAHLERMTWSAEQVREHQERELRALLRCALERSPFHRERLSGIDPDHFGVADLPRLPVMTKDEMMTRFDDVVTDRRVHRDLVDEHVSDARDEPRALLDGYGVLASGGSSGRRGVFVYDRDTLVDYLVSPMRRGVAMIASLMGWPPPEPVPFTIVAAPTAGHATRAGSALIDGALGHLTLAPATLPFADVVARVQRSEPLVLVGYPSLITKLADAQAAGALAIAPFSITCTSEPLSREQADRIHDAFGVAPSNCFGSTEGVCGSAAPGDDVIELCSDTAIVELVDADDQPVPAGTEAHHVLVTSLLSRAQPLIRYRLDDRMAEADPSPDHGHLRVRVLGRHDPVLHVGGGDVHPLTVRSTLLRHPSVCEYQVTARTDRLHVDAIAAGELDTAAVATDLERALTDAGAQVPVTVQVVEALPRDALTGKVRRFVTA